MLRRWIMLGGLAIGCTEEGEVTTEIPCAPVVLVTVVDGADTPLEEATVESADEGCPSNGGNTFECVLSGAGDHNLYAFHEGYAPWAQRVTAGCDDGPVSVEARLSNANGGM